MKNIYILLILVVGLNATVQVAINADGSAPDNSAMLDVQSSSNGLLPPRMTQEQIGSIANPANGLVAFCTTDNKI
jgi:trimeric autotransporter adhesin